MPHRIEQPPELLEAIREFDRLIINGTDYHPKPLNWPDPLTMYSKAKLEDVVQVGESPLGHEHLLCEMHFRIRDVRVLHATMSGLRHHLTDLTVWGMTRASYRFDLNEHGKWHTAHFTPDMHALLRDLHAEEMGWAQMHSGV